MSWRNHKLSNSRLLKREALVRCVYISAGQEMPFSCKSIQLGRGATHTPHVVPKKFSKATQKVQNSAVSFPLFVRIIWHNPEIDNVWRA